MSHFAVALLGKGGRQASWLIEEVDIDSCETIDDIVEVLRDFDQPVRLLAVEQDDEYAVLARLDSSADENDEPMRVFLSNGHSADDYPLRVADQLPELLSAAGLPGPDLSPARDPDPLPRRHAGLRLAGVHPASLGPQGAVLLPLEGSIQVVRTVSEENAPSASNSASGRRCVGFKRKCLRAPSDPTHSGGSWGLGGRRAATLGRGRPGRSGTLLRSAIRGR